jgi:hypothetical protein
MSDPKTLVRYPGTGTPEDECPPPAPEELSKIDIEGFAQKIREMELPSVLSLMCPGGQDNGVSNYEGRINPLLLKQRVIGGKIEWVQWNVRKTENGLYLGRDCNDHPAVRGTTYMEINQLLGTSGCSTEFPHYDWSRMGVIETLHGKQVVSPGNWIGTLLPGVHVVMTEDEYQMYIVR